LTAEAKISRHATPDGAPLGAGEMWKDPRGQLRRMLAAGMLGAAVFLVQAGAIEIIERGDQMCRETRASNWAFNAKGCQPETVRYMMQGLSLGPVGFLWPDLPPVLGVATMAVVMGVVAAFLGFLPLREAILAFFLVEAGVAFLFGFLGYVLPYLG